MEHLKEKLVHLSWVLQKNGYKLRDINRAFKKEKEKNKANNQYENMKHTFLPYIQGTTYIIAKILKQKHIRTSFYPQNFLRNMLDRVKYPIDPKSRKGIYSIMWSGDEIYIGETSHSVKVRLKEHCADIMHNRIKKSAVAKHSKKSNLRIYIEDTKVIAIEEYHNRKRISEAIKVEKHHKNLNTTHKTYYT